MTMSALSAMQLLIVLIDVCSIRSYSRLQLTGQLFRVYSSDSNSLMFMSIYPSHFYSFLGNTLYLILWLRTYCIGILIKYI